MKLLSIKLVKAYDENPDTSFLGYYSNEWEESAIETKRDGRFYKYFIPQMSEPEYALQDYKFMEAYERGEHIAYHVYAKAEIETLGTVQIIKTGGMGGFFDEVDDEYYDDELCELKEILRDMGISEEEISKICPVKVDD